LAQGQDQDDTKPALEDGKPLERPKRPENKISIPAGAQILLRLEHAITTKSAKIGDPIYAVTTSLRRRRPDASAAGTYVQGRISAIQRPGRVKGRAELLFHFTTLIYPNGYTVLLPGAVDNVQEWSIPQ